MSSITIVLALCLTVVNGGMVIPGQDFRTAICAEMPDSLICAELVPESNSVQDYPSHADNEDSPFGVTISTNLPSTIKSGTNEETKKFCVAYSRHYKAYCMESEIHDPSELNQDQDKIQKFCGSYSGSCNGDYEIQIQIYCEKYQKHYQYFCKNPFEHGPKAAKFCPLYAMKCNSRFDVPLFEPGVLFDNADEVKTTTPAGTSTLDWFYIFTTTCGLDCLDPSSLSDDEIHSLCVQNKDQGDRYCFGPIGESSTYKAKCDYYKKYCVLKTTPAPGNSVATNDPWAYMKTIEFTTLKPRLI